MVESPVTAPGSDALLATKLHMPGPRPGQVLRPRLTARLDEGLARGLVLASAPAGYGKTVLLADWARHGEHPVAWLSLDAGDNDPARFWHHAVAVALLISLVCTWVGLCIGGAVQIWGLLKHIRNHNSVSQQPASVQLR